MDNTEYRHVPYDIEVEQALLGSLVLDNQLIDEVSAELEPTHFFDPLHQRLYEMIVHLQTEGAVTPLVVASVMKADPGLKEVGGHAYLAGLAESAPAGREVERFSKILRELSMRRSIIRLGEDIVNAAFEQPHEMSAQQIASDATETLLQITSAVSRPVLTGWEIAQETLQEIEDAARGKPVPIVKTGIDKLDAELGGFRGGDFIVIAAKSGMGKSALMGSIARNTAAAGVPTIVFSLEMVRRQWIERMVCDIDFDTAEKPMHYSSFRSGRLKGNEFSRFGEAAATLHTVPFEIRDEDNLTMQQIASVARAFKAKHRGKIGIVLLDYVQIINPGDNRDRSREQTVAGFARGCKSLAKLLNWPIVGGSQMNEGAEHRGADEKRPQASDVRESKGIMNEADLILSPYRQAYFVQNRRPTDILPGDPRMQAWRDELTACVHRMDLLGLKNRHGSRFELELWCEMASNAVRSEMPNRYGSVAQRELSDLVAGGRF